MNKSLDSHEESFKRMDFLERKRSQGFQSLGCQFDRAKFARIAIRKGMPL